MILGIPLPYRVQILAEMSSLLSAPVFVNDTFLKFRIPFGDYDPFDFELQFKNNLGEEVVLHNPFELYAPVIDSIPGSFGFRETVVLYGKHLTNSPSNKNNILFLDEIDIEVSQHSKDSIVFTLPWQVQKYQYDVLVKAQLQEVTKLGGLQVAAPQLDSVSKKDVEIGEQVTIYGSYFYPYQPNLNHIYFQGNRAEVLEAYRDSLVIKIPMGPYKSRYINNLKISLFEKEVTLDVDLNLTSTWYMYGFKRSSDISNFNGVGEVTDWGFWANNAYYLNVYRQYENHQIRNDVLYRYTPETDNWEEIDLPIPPENLKDAEVLQFFPLQGSNIVYLYINQAENNFYKFNIKTGELLQLKDFAARDFLQIATGFFANGNFYLGLGYTSNPSQVSNKKFWRYSEGANSWTEITSMPDVHDTWPRFGTSLFKNGNTVYIGNGHEQAYDFWEFSPNETWTRKSDVQNPSGNTVDVQNGTSGFYYDYLRSNFWEFDIPSNLWTKREDLKIKGYPYGHETMFIHDNYVYFVVYLNDYGPDGTPFFRYDQAILRTELSNFN